MTRKQAALKDLHSRGDIPGQLETTKAHCTIYRQLDSLEISFSSSVDLGLFQAAGLVTVFLAAWLMSLSSLSGLTVYKALGKEGPRTFGQFQGHPKSSELLISWGLSPSL